MFYHSICCCNAFADFGKKRFVMERILLLSILLVSGFGITAQDKANELFKTPDQVFTKKWKTEIPQCVMTPGQVGNSTESRGEPLIVGDVMFHPGGYCSAVDTRSGKILSFGNPADIKHIRQVLKGDSLLIVPSNNSFAIVNFNTGNFEFLQTRKSFSPVLNTPVVPRESQILFALDHYTLACFDIRKHTILWRFQSKKEISEQYVSFQEHFVASDNESIYWINKKTGQATKKLDVGGRFYSNLLMTGNNLIVQIRNKGITSIDLLTKKINWQHTSTHANVFSKLIEYNGSVMFFLDGLMALTVNSGQVLWKNTDIQGGTLVNWLAGPGNLLTFYSRADDNTYASVYRKSDGKPAFESWAVWQDWADQNTPFYFGDYFYFSHADNSLYGYDYEFINDEKVFYAYAYSIKTK